MKDLQKSNFDKTYASTGDVFTVIFRSEALISTDLNASLGGDRRKFISW